MITHDILLSDIFQREFPSVFPHGLHISRNPLKLYNCQEYFQCFNTCCWCQHMSVFMFVQGLFKSRSKLAMIQLVLILMAEPKFASISASIKFVFPDRLHWWTWRHEVIYITLQETSLVSYKPNLTRTEQKKFFHVAQSLKVQTHTEH